MNNYDLVTLIDKSFSDGELEIFCLKHYYQVFNNFGSGYSKNQRIKDLISYCNQHSLINELIKKIKIERPNSFKDEKVNQLKFLFISSSPIDDLRLSSEFDSITKKLETQIKEETITLLPPVWNTDYEKLLNNLNIQKPNVLHYSGHGNENSLSLTSAITNKTQPLKNNELIGLFETRNSYLKFIFLNSCFSSVQAQIISKTGIYVLGIKGSIENVPATKLAECFYLGFSSQISSIKIEKAIKIGITNFEKNYPSIAPNIILWKNGEKKSHYNLY